MRVGSTERDVRVLFVEDEPIIRVATAELLEDHGFDVTATCTGEEAVILLAENDFDLLLTDVTMPGAIDGIGLSEHAREMHPGLPIVLVSGAPGSEQRVQMLEQPTAFFLKPYDVDALVGVVERMALAAAD